MKRVLIVSESPADRTWLKKLLREAAKNTEESSSALSGGENISCDASNASITSIGNAPRGGGLTIHAVENIPAAVEILKHRKIDGTILDFGLALSEDIGPIVELKQANARVPIVALTNHKDARFSLKAIEAGATEYLDKETLDGIDFFDVLRRAFVRGRIELEREQRILRLEEANGTLERKVRESETKIDDLRFQNRELDDFASTVAHDLKEPLGGMAAYSEILVEECGDLLEPDMKKRLVTINTLCSRLSHLIDDLLTYVRLDRKKSRREAVDLNRTLNELLHMLEPAIQHRRAAVQIHGELPCVQGNATLLGMVFGNLIGNGMKFNENELPCIQIGCCASNPPTFYVHDDGIGIPEEHHENVFDMFRRLHPRKKYEGTGAGLGIVRKIVELHGGRVWVESKPGAGSTFYFTLQAAPVAPEEPIVPRPHFTQSRVVIGD